MNNQTINEIKKRDLDKVWFSLTIISQEVYYNFGNDYIKKRTINTIFGCNINGVRRYITSVFDDEYPKASDWYDLLLSFKNRGLETIFFVIIPKNNNIKNAFDLICKETNYIYHSYNIINKLYHYVSFSFSNDILNYIKDIILVDNINEFNMRKEEFINLYESTPFITDMLNEELKTFPNYLNYPVFIRKHIFSFYFIREFIKKLSKIAHSQCYFNNIEEFEILLLPYIKVFETKMYCGKDEWNKVITYLYKDYKELLLCAL